MGVLMAKLNWIAVENGDKARLLTELGLREIGTVDEASEAYMACGVAPTGWLVVVDQSMSLELERLLPAVSAGGLAVGCEFTEVVMVSQAQAWRDGRLAWRVSHDPGKGLMDLSVEGAPPAQLDEIRARCAAEQEADADGLVDYTFDAPVDLARVACGYHHSDQLPAPWSILAAPHRGLPPDDSALPHVIRTDVLPQLPSLGWDGPPVHVAEINRQFDATRIRNGRLEALRFRWLDDGRDLEISPSVATLATADPGGEVLSLGMIPLPQASARRGFGEMLRQIGKPKPSYDERVRAVVAQLLTALPSLDRIIDER